MTTNGESHFKGADREHARRAIALAASLSSEGYLLAQHIDEDTETVFSPGQLQEFVRDGFLPDDMYLKPRHLHVGWRIDARVYTHGRATPNTPWFYQHCFLRYYGVGPISGDDFTKTKNEWRHTRPAFGETVHAAGDKLLQIAQMVRADPDRFEGTPYIDIRCSEDSSDYLELLAFADIYWLHLFQADCKQVEDTSVITISFTPRVDDDPTIPPEGNENLLTASLSTPQ